MDTGLTATVPPQIRPPAGTDRPARRLRAQNCRQAPVPYRDRGQGSEDPRPAFDQQPVQVSALADACARAAVVDNDPMWSDGVRAAVAWFLGVNDAGEPMRDPGTGAGYEGLQADGVNSSQCAESTLAVISTLQQARRLSTVLQ